MSSTTDYLTREEVLESLGIKAATLYAYVSRGLLRSVRTPQSRYSLYRRDEVERLGARRRGAKGRVGAAAGSMRWGEPVVSTSITRIGPEGPFYRNRSAQDLAQSQVSFEAVVQLLATGLWQPAAGAWGPVATPRDTLRQLRIWPQAHGSADVGRLFAAAVLSLGMEGRGQDELAGAAPVSPTRLIVQTLAGCLGLVASPRKFVERKPAESMAGLVLRAAGAHASDEARLLVNQTLVMLADHELAAASFVSRVVASTHSDLFNCVAAAICAHAGSSAAAAADLVDQQLFAPLSNRSAASVLALVRARGASTFGFNHTLYPDGDPRANYILGLVEQLGGLDAGVRRFLTLLRKARVEAGAHPGLAVALVAVVRALRMTPDCAGAIWMIGRAAGWIAHASEQRTQAFMMRPRARYADVMEASQASGPLLA